MILIRNLNRHPHPLPKEIGRGTATATSLPQDPPTEDDSFSDECDTSDVSLAKVSQSPAGSSGALTESCSFSSSDSSVSEEVQVDDGRNRRNALTSTVPFKELMAAEGCAAKSEHYWSDPPSTAFQVRGRNYLMDHKKVESGRPLFVPIGTDLYLTKNAPDFFSSHPAVLGGRLREKPSFVFSFRFPFGILVFCFEIPEQFLPFIRNRYENDESLLFDPSPMDSMSPAEKSTCRFLMASDSQRNASLKLIPKVLEGPWIIRNMVAGTPVIIGSKLPTKYIYHAADELKGHAECLEAVLDIGDGLKPRAKKIVSVCHKYMDLLTVDLGLVVEGGTAEELPEQMMAAVRVHKLSPRLSPMLPPIANN